MSPPDKLAHDLRSPLAVVTGFAELLASDRELSLAERREFAERIAAAAAEIGRLVDGAAPG